MSGSTKTESRYRWELVSLVAAAAFAALIPGAAPAGEADVVGVAAKKMRDGSYRFDVTVRHADTGWKHYADRWDVIGPGGKVLGVRTLLHPHDNEQPFTRSLSPVRVPSGVRRVTVRAHDKVHGLGGREMTVALPDR